MLSTLLWTANVVVCLPLVLIALFTCYWSSYTWSSPEHYDGSKFVHTRDTEEFSFSIIVPVREEIFSVMAATIGRLLAQTHSRVQAVLSVGHDDPETLAHARRLIAEDPTGRLVLSVSRSDVHNKPTQLNAALQDCTGDIVGILDSESLSAPDLLTQVDAVFQDSGVSVVQGGVLMSNYRSSWVALRSSIEYFCHHASKMHYSAAHDAILMGGNTCWFKRDLLLELGGWDEQNLAEDAEISLRLLALGHRVTVAYDPLLVSYEEAPITMRAWVKQRVRWNLGFLQTIKKGVWRDFPAKQRRLILLHLLQPTIIAVTGLVLPLSILSFFLSHPPLPIAMLTWLPALPTLLTVVIECAQLRIYSMEHGEVGPARFRDYAKLVLTTPMYQIMLSVGAVRAYYKFFKKDFKWDRTVHEGLHIAAADWQGVE